MGFERCNYCLKEMGDIKLKRCANCKAAFYCSKECQKAHWEATHKVVHARIEETAQMVKLAPGLKEAAETLPDLEWPRLRCFFFFRDDGPNKLDQARAQAWCLTNLLEVCYGMDKDHSRAISRLAIPQLLNEINVIGQPRQAAERFKYMVLDLDLYRELTEKTDNGGQPLEKQFEQILHVGD